MENRRVAVTGIGIVSPLGTGTEKTWKAALEGKNGAGPITLFDTTDYPVKIAAEVNDFDPADWMDKKDARRLGRFVHFAQAGATMAFDDAKLKKGDFDPFRAGTLIGSGIGGLEKIEEQKAVILEHGPRKINVFFIPSEIINMASGYVSMQYGLKGPNSAVVTACSTGNHAIGDAHHIIKRGDADIMVAGGTEATVSPLAVAGFAKMRATSRRNDEPLKASRPFDINRDGFLMGEGAGILILEELEHAKARGAKIYAEIVGYGMTGDAYHFTAPDVTSEGPARVMKIAIEHAGIKPEQIDYINAHGTATPVGDPLEVKAIKMTFGDYAYKVPITSSKSMTGHLLGAAGGLEGGLTLLSLHHQIVPPTINLDDPDPLCDLDFVPLKSRKVKMDYALTNSFGFGGTNSCLVFKRYTE